MPKKIIATSTNRVGAPVNLIQEQDRWGHTWESWECAGCGSEKRALGYDSDTIRAGAQDHANACSFQAIK